METRFWALDTLPIYGCLTGIDLPDDSIEIFPGVALRRTYVATFGASMMAFSPPPSPQSHHPTPWAAVRSGFSFESHTEVVLSDMIAFDGLAPSVVAWLVAAVLRLYMQSPIRMAVIASMPFRTATGERWQEVEAYAFENAPRQFGSFTSERSMATEADIAWLRDMLPVAVPVP